MRHFFTKLGQLLFLGAQSFLIAALLLLLAVSTILVLSQATLNKASHTYTQVQSAHHSDSIAPIPAPVANKYSQSNPVMPIQVNTHMGNDSLARSGKFQGPISTSTSTNTRTSTPTSTKTPTGTPTGTPTLTYTLHLPLVAKEVVFASALEMNSLIAASSKQPSSAGEILQLASGESLPLHRATDVPKHSSTAPPAKIATPGQNSILPNNAVAQPVLAQERVILRHGLGMGILLLAVFVLAALWSGGPSIP